MPWYRIFLGFTLAVLMLASPLAAQTPDTLWTRIYWNGWFDSANCVQETSDRGFILVGATRAEGHAEGDIFLIKTDSLGWGEWSQIIGDDVHYECGYYVLEAADGGYLIAGGSDLSGSAGVGGVWIVKTNSVGDTLWTRTWCPDDRVAFPYYAIITEEGDYAITGVINLAGGTFNDAFILRIDDDGNFVDAETYGDYHYQDGQYITQMADSGFIVTGGCDSLYSTGYDYWAFRVNKGLAVIWDSTYAITDYYDEAFAVCRVEDGIVMAGPARGTGHVHKINFDGHTQWSKEMSIYPTYERYNTMCATDDGGMMVGGWYGVSGHRRDFAFLKLDADGNIEWNFDVGGSEDDHGQSMVETYDGNFVIAGVSSSFVNGSSFYVVKLGMKCCELRVGDVNNNGEDEPTIGDISMLVDALYITRNFDQIACLPEADINQSGGVAPINDDLTIGDISLLVDYLYITGPDEGALMECF